MRKLLPVFLLLALAGAIAQQISREDLIAPAALAARLKGPAATKPPILYAGFAILYRSKHIPGSIFAGPASTAQGLDLLKREASRLPRDQELILYCGCCPWDHCPNVRPALQALRQMGFKQVKVVDLPTNFAEDWIGKGYPVQDGPAPSNR